MKSIQSISIIGTGNLAFHLGTSLVDEGVQIDYVFGRNEEKATALANRLHARSANKISEIESDLVLICVSDDAISEIIAQFPEQQKIAYTSGSVELDNFKNHKNVGVFYPLQTFSINRTIQLNEVPFLIEATNSDFSKELIDLAWKLSSNVTYADSQERKRYHLAAVWVNNFTNHMVYQAKTIAERNALNWDFLLPLLKETTAKASSMNPKDAQTGPARRNDNATIRAHEAMLKGMQKEIYTLLSKSIKDTYND